MIRCVVQRCLLVLVTGGLLIGCSGPERAKPAELGANPALIGVRQVWKSSISAATLDLRARGNSVLVTGVDGVVAEIDARTGADIWRTKLAAPLSAGAGTDGRYTAVVSRSNDLIALESGKEIWRQRLNALTVTPPLVAGERVFVLSSDRSVSAFDAATGRRLWQQQRTGDPLVLGHSGVIMAVGDTLVAGLGGRLVGMNPQSGTARWDTALATSRGTNDVERLIDLVSGVSRQGNVLCLRAFQTAAGCIDASNGKLLWSKPASGSSGIAGDASNIFGAESDGKVLAWQRADGEVLWTNDRFRFRYLTTPLLVGNSLVVGDDSGNVHFLARRDGSVQTRLPTDGSALTLAPVLVGQIVVVATQRGAIFGFRPD